jgi:hypothetical protein
MVEPSFRLELLPDAARDVLFAFLRRDEAARACCVGVAWRDAFSTAAVAHLWAPQGDVTFDAASFGPRQISEAVVRGAAAKAGAQLRSLTRVPCACLGVVPALAAAHPTLQRVSVADSVDLAFTDQVGLALAAAAAVPELHFSFCCENVEFVEQSQEVRALLQHPHARLTGLWVTADEASMRYATEVFGPDALGVLRAAEAVVRAHSGWLRSLHVVLDFETPRAEAEEDAAEVASFAAVLERCASLEYLCLGELFEADAFEVVAQACARGCRALRTLRLQDDDVSRYAAVAATHLLPSLQELELQGLEVQCLTGGAAGLRALCAALPACAALRRVSLERLTVNGPRFYEPFARALADAPAVRELELDMLTAGAMQALATAGLPPSLESLEATNLPGDAEPLLRAAAALPRLASAVLQFPCTGFQEQTAAQAAAAACALFAAPALRSVELRCARGNDRNGAPDAAQMAAHLAAVGTAARHCASLRALHLRGSASSADVLFALAAEALRGNATLQQLRIDLSDGIGAAVVARAAQPLAELAVAVRTASALRALRLHVAVFEDEWRFYANDELVAQARQALADAAAPTCLVRVEATK